MGQAVTRGLLVLASVVTACSAPVTSVAAPSCAASSLIVATSVYNESSEVGLLALDGGAEFYAGGATLGGDPSLASSRGRLFWIDRYGGGVLELDPRCATILHGPWITSDSDAAGATDPQDIAVAPDGTLWIARFDAPSLLIKSADGSQALGTIDLSSVAGIHKNPRMSSVRIIDGAGSSSKAYVALEMLNDALQSVDPSYMVRIDVATHAIEATLKLQGRNPFGLIVESPDALSLYLAEPGNTQIIGETAAGIERVDLASFTSTLIVRESDLGASVDQVSVTSGCGTAIVMGPGPVNVTSIISFDPQTGTVVTPASKGLLYTDAGFELAGMAWLDGGINVVGDQTAVTGKGYAVHVLTASPTCSLTERPAALFTPQPPVALQPVP